MTSTTAEVMPIVQIDDVSSKKVLRENGQGNCKVHLKKKLRYSALLFRLNHKKRDGTKVFYVKKIRTIQRNSKGNFVLVRIFFTILFSRSINFINDHPFNGTEHSFRLECKAASHWKASVENENRMMKE